MEEIWSSDWPRDHLNLNTGMNQNQCSVDEAWAVVKAREHGECARCVTRTINLTVDTPKVTFIFSVHKFYCSLQYSPDGMQRNVNGHSSCKLAPLCSRHKYMCISSVHLLSRYKNELSYALLCGLHHAATCWSHLDATSAMWLVGQTQDRTPWLS